MTSKFTGWFYFNFDIVPHRASNAFTITFNTNNTNKMTVTQTAEIVGTSAT